MIFLPSSVSVAGSSPESGATTADSGSAASTGVGSGKGAATGLGAAGVSSDCRIREIGGSTVVFFLTSPGSAFFLFGSLSISETLATLRRGAGAAGFSEGAAAAGLGGAACFAGAAWVRAVGLASGSFFFGAGFDFDTAVRAAGALRAAGFPDVLLVVFVAI